MLPEVGNISLSVLANVNQCKTRKLLVHVAAPLGREATMLLVPARSLAQSWELLLPTQLSPLWDEKISRLWWPYSSHEDVDTPKRKLFLPETGPHSHGFYMYLTLFTKGQLKLPCLPNLIHSVYLNISCHFSWMWHFPVLFILQLHNCHTFSLSWLNVEGGINYYSHTGICTTVVFGLGTNAILCYVGIWI